MDDPHCYTDGTINEQSAASFWRHADVLLSFVSQRQSAEVEVGDEEHANEHDQTHEQSETVCKHALWREMHILSWSSVTITTAHDVFICLGNMSYRWQVRASHGARGTMLAQFWPWRY